MAADDFRNFLDEAEELIRGAYLGAVDRMRRQIVVSRLIEAILNNDDMLVFDLAGAKQSFLSRLADAVIDAFIRGGREAVADLPYIQDPISGITVQPSFDFSEPRSSDWLRQYSASLVQGITEDTRNGLRETLATARAEGRSPNATALDISGRVSRATGRREGGLLGLTRRQMGAADKAMSELLSGDPGQLRAYLRRGARDRRYDRTIQKAIREGKPLKKDQARKIIGRYRDRLLKTRADAIAQTESTRAGHAGANTAIQQMVDSGLVQRSQVRKVWQSTPDGRTRDAHSALHGESIQFDRPFISPTTGAELMHPGDTSRGAPGSDLVNCRCWMNIRIDRKPNR